MDHQPEHAKPKTRSALNLRYSGRAPLYLVGVLALPAMAAWNLLRSGVLWEQVLGAALLAVQAAVIIAAVRYLLRPVDPASEVARDRSNEQMRSRNILRPLRRTVPGPLGLKEPDA